MHLFRLPAVAVAALVAILAAPCVAAAAPSASGPEGPVPAPPQPAALPADPTVLDAARAKVAAGNTKGAIEGLAPYVAQHPQDTAAGRLLGDLYFRVPDFNRAEKGWQAVLSVVPDDRETHSRLGSLYAAQDRISESIAAFQK